MVRGAGYYQYVSDPGRIFTSVDQKKFSALLIMHVATRFEELIKD